MDIEKDLKQMFKDEAIAVDTFGEVFVKFITENHEVKKERESLDICYKEYSEAEKHLVTFKQMWLDIVSSGEDLHGGVAFEDNVQQRMWDCLGDVYGKFIISHMELCSLQRSKTFFKYDVLFILHEELSDSLGKIAKSKDVSNIDNTIFYLKELTKTTKDLILSEETKA